MEKFTVCPFYRWCFIVMILVLLQLYYNLSLSMGRKETANEVEEPPDSEELTTYKKFITIKSHIKNLGEEETPTYPKNTPVCRLNVSTLGPITANKTNLTLEWVEKQYPEVKPGGFHAPKHCRSRHKVAIFVPYKNRERNLAIFLYHIHPFLQKQLIEYRIFVIEQTGRSKKFNKGSIYNVAFLETQLFGIWHCLIFHDVDLLPLDERNLYSCPRSPTHMSSAVESHGYHIPYLQLFGGVTVMTPAHFLAVNGYSNAYWGWGAEDDDMFTRLQARRFKVLRYNTTIGRYATLPHEVQYDVNERRYYFLSLAKRRFRTEGLSTIRYKLVGIRKRRLFTHIMADVNPFNIKV